VDVQVGTLSKALGSLGATSPEAGRSSTSCGIVAGLRLLHLSPAAVVAASIAAIDMLLEEPALIDRLWRTRGSSRRA